MPNFSPEGYLAWRRMIATDHMSPEKWQAHAEALSAEQLQRETLRQATDAKLQLISILNALHLALVGLFLGVLLLAIVAWRLW